MEPDELSAAKRDSMVLVHDQLRLAAVRRPAYEAADTGLLLMVLGYALAAHVLACPPRGPSCVSPLLFSSSLPPPPRYRRCSRTARRYAFASTAPCPQATPAGGGAWGSK